MANLKPIRVYCDLNGSVNYILLESPLSIIIFFFMNDHVETRKTWDIHIGIRHDKATKTHIEDGWT